MERVAVIGAGLMGHGIAQVFAVAGHPVTITDESAEVLETVHERVRANLSRSGGNPDDVERIRPVDGLEEAVENAVLVIEAAPENLELKQALFARLSLASPDAILASNTSVMSIGEIARDAVRPERVVGTHFWNPPHLVPLVEVTQAERTTLATVERTMSLMEGAGKTPVHVKRDVPGFIGNRLQHALWREAIALVEEDICSAEDVDLVVKSTLGLKLRVLGPLENADLIGLDLTYAIHDYVLPHIDARPHPSPLLRRLVEQEALGMKAGRGFREWTDEGAERVRERLFDHLVAATAETVAAS
jgi:3-hydroxybutyryl-CoA dehydrogenase